MTHTQRAAMEQALKALKPIAAGNINSVISDAAYAAATSLIAALAEPAPVQEPFENDRVMTVVYYDPSKEDVDSIMSHPKAKWFGWCHAPYQRDHYKSLLEAQQPAPQAQQPAPPADVPMLTEDEVEAVQEGIAVDDFAHDLVRRTERLVRQKAGLQ